MNPVPETAGQESHPGTCQENALFSRVQRSVPGHRAQKAEHPRRTFILEVRRHGDRGKGDKRRDPLQRTAGHLIHFHPLQTGSSIL